MSQVLSHGRDIVESPILEAHEICCLALTAVACLETLVERVESIACRPGTESGASLGSLRAPVVKVLAIAFITALLAICPELNTPVSGNVVDSKGQSKLGKSAAGIGVQVLTSCERAAASVPDRVAFGVPDDIDGAGRSHKIEKEGELHDEET